MTENASYLEPSADTIEDNLESVNIIPEVKQYLWHMEVKQETKTKNHTAGNQ